jgi:hypothetical protein
MTDDSANESKNPFFEDPRIVKLVGGATSLMEVVLNAEFLLSEYATSFLENNCPETAELALKLGMSPEQKFLLAVGAMGVLEDTWGGGLDIFGYHIELFRIRAKVGSCSEDKLLAELTSAFIRTGGDSARVTLKKNNDDRDTMQYITVNYLKYAQAFFEEDLEDVEDKDSAEAFLGEDLEDDDDDDDGDTWKK